MESVKCPRCGLVNWTQDVCKRCGETLPVSRQETFQAQRAAAYRPKKAGMVIALIIGLMIGGLFLFGLLTAPRKTSVDPHLAELAEKRRQFAYGLQNLTNPVSAAGNVTWGTEGLLDTTLTMTADFLEQRDCQAFYMSDWARTAESVGFKKLKCRNRNTGQTWETDLHP
jgi:hypothetical protein